MNTQLKRKVLRATALILLFSMGLEIIVPTAAYALTSGPASPEFSSFEPVTTTNMVNTFTGDFTYNLPVLQIPGPDGGGYAMSLAYHSGANSEEEDRKSTRLNSSHQITSYAVFCLKKKKKNTQTNPGLSYRI